jgi:FkbM family methyltransferase
VSVGKVILSLAKPLVERYPRMASLYRGVRDQLAFMDEPVITPWGFKLSGNPAMAGGMFEPVETEVVTRILRDVDVLVNVGANIGYYCSHALHMGKFVIAFEPMQKNLRFLCQNVKANNWKDIEIYPVALSNQVGVLEMYGADTGASIVKGWAGTSESYVTLVPSASLDIVLGSRLRGKKVLVLIDVEGAETGVLQGATTLLRNDPKPLWLLEISSTEHQPQGIAVNPHFANTFKIMFDAGYEAVTADKTMRRITWVEIVAAQAGDPSIFATHNFLFR